MSRLWQLAPMALLCACSGIGWFDKPPPTLADLQPASLPDDRQPLPQVSLAELTDIYKDVLAHQQDPQTQLQVTHRLADIEMLDAEERLALSAEADADFGDAIATYENLLQSNPDYPQQDKILYQLSKAHALSGEADKSQAALNKLAEAAPESPYLAEAYFRQAERQFVATDYAAAEQLYARVITYGADTPYFTRALYMQGWSRFKQDRYNDSIAAFTTSLDHLLDQDPSLEALPRGEQELVQDSLRVLAIVFSKLDGVATIDSAYATLGQRPYEHRLYESLGMLYLSQERYADSAQAYQAFIARQPDSRRAHHFQLRVIEAYEQGGFAEKIVTAKQDYVEAFSVTGNYYKDSGDTSQQAMNEHLKRYIPELASHHHALAQSGKKSIVQTPENHYAMAARYYKLYLDSFPDDPEVPRLAFLLAESQYEAGDYLSAIDTYEWVAYSHGDPTNAADAAYTGILAYGKLDAQPHGAATPELARLRIDAELRFQSSFPSDSRAPAVLGHATTALMNLEDYSGALTAASTLLTLTPRPDAELLTPALLVSGHSHFALQDYRSAEDAYEQSLTLLAVDDARTAPARERLAAAIYRQGEAAVATNEHGTAAAHYQRAMAAAPDSDVGIHAQFDAAQALIQADEPGQANTLLHDLRQRYPEHELAAGVGVTLLQNYEYLEQWQEAAQELDILYEQATGGDQNRETLLMAARYYDKAGDSATATARYSSYVQAFPEPVTDALEATDRLANLYADAGDTQQQQIWLGKIMTLHEQAGTQQTDRSRYLAAHAASVVAESQFKAFSTLPLSQPIKNSLPAKKIAMEKALEAYNRCNSYAVEQFSTLCTYKLGSIYQQLSTDLLDSERPHGLDALALEQYDILLEEQAFPFEDKAIAIHESNAMRCREGVYDQWVQQSFAALGELQPARYQKREIADASQLAAGADGAAGIGSSTTPRKIRNFNRDGIALREQGEFEDAEQEYLSALAVAADDPVTHHNIGILYDLYLGIPHMALTHYQRYQELTGDGDRRVAGWIVDLQRRHVSLAEEAL